MTLGQLTRTWIQAETEIWHRQTQARFSRIQRRTQRVDVCLVGASALHDDLGRHPAAATFSDSWCRASEGPQPGQLPLCVTQPIATSACSASQ